MILAGRIAFTYTWQRSIARSFIRSHRVIVAGGIAIFSFQVAYSQIDQVVAHSLAINKVKTQTTFRHDYKGTLPAGAEYRSVFTEYNAMGKKIAEKTFNEVPEILKQYTAVYDSSYKILKEVWTEQNSDSVVYKYTGANLTEERWYWGEDKTKSKITHAYDANDRMVCTVSQYDFGKMVDSIFYENGNIAWVKTYNEYGQYSYAISKKYDAKGNLAEETKTDAAGALQQKTSKTYYETGLLKSIQTSYYAPQTEAAYSQATESYKYQKGMPTEQTIIALNNNVKTNEVQSTYKFDLKGLLTEVVTINTLTKEKNVFRYTYTFQ